MEKISLRTTKPKLPPVIVIRTVNKLRDRVGKIQKSLVPAPAALLEMISGQWIAQAIGVAAKLGLADYMSEEGQSVEELAKKTGAKVEPLYRLLRALTVCGIMVELENRQFKLTSIGRVLQTDHPQSMRYVAIFQTQVNWANWGALDHCVMTGGNAVEHVWKEKPFEHLAKNKDKAEIFDKAMTNISRLELDAVLAAYDFSSYNVIADIGGGYGTLLASILMTHPRARGMLYDLPHVVEGANDYFKKTHLSGRVDVQAGSFFDSVPAGADAYLMKHIIHDWSDEESVKILKNIRQKMKPDGKVLLVETVVPAPNEAHFSKFLDLEMLVVTTGKERTEEEFQALFAQAGFKLDRIVPTISMASVIEASPA